MATWSAKWKASKRPTKQRNYVRKAPLHIKSGMLVSTLSKDLRKKHTLRNARVRKGDTVKVLRGQFKGKSGKIDRVNVKDSKAYVLGIETVKKDGSKSLYPIHPSNLMITELNLNDKKRIKEKKQ